MLEKQNSCIVAIVKAVNISRMKKSRKRSLEQRLRRVKPPLQRFQSLCPSLQLPGPLMSPKKVFRGINLHQPCDEIHLGNSLVHQTAVQIR